MVQLALARILGSSARPGCRTLDNHRPMPYLKVLSALVLCTTLTTGARAQSATEDSVKTAVNALFIAMKSSDAPGIRASFADSAVLQTIVTNKEGKTIARNEAVGDFAESISKLAKGDADEQIRFDVIKIDGPLAIVWAPYKFYFKGKFSHCGVDSFQLIRTAGGWKLLYIVDTRRKDACE
jgi:hypothetical protein